MKRVIETAFICAVFVLLAGLAALTVLLPRSDYSYYENRTLAASPQFSVTALLDGEYFPAWESWLSDHLFGRERLLKADGWLDLHAARRPVVNNVAITDRALLPYFAAAEPQDYAAAAEDMAARLAALAQQVEGYGGRFLYVGVPEQCSALRDYYPDYLSDNSAVIDARAEAFWSALERAGVEYVDLRPWFTAQPDVLSYYSATDHHYNLLGAYQTYEQICAALSGQGLAVRAADGLRFTQLDAPFLGSRARRLLGASLVDRLYTYTLPQPPSFTREDNGEAVEAAVFAPLPPAGEPLLYDYYMGGDVAETVIRTDRAELPDVLLFGDSFTNALETMLYLSCDTMYSLDLRYYQGMSLSEYIDHCRPDAVICVRDDLSYLLAEGNGAFD